MVDKSLAIYPGTFDIFTNGHEDILNRALNIFDHVTLLVAVSPKKKTLFSRDQIKEMLETLFKDEPRVSVAFHSGLVVEYAKNEKIGNIVRGLRPTGDFEYEFQMASMNSKLNKDIDTVFLMTSGDHYFISSSMLREILFHDGDISNYVPKSIYSYIKKNHIGN